MTSWNGMASIGTDDSVTDRGWARLPTTTTRSSSCTDSSTSSVIAAPAPTATPARTAVPKSGNVNVTSYVPGASPLNVNRPVWSVRVTCPPPAASRASTVTPGRTRPVLSLTVPEIAVSWALAMPDAKTVAVTTSTIDVLRLFLITSPVLESANLGSLR